MLTKVILAILLSVSILFGSLPKKVLADKYLLQAKQSMESKDYKNAQIYFEKILSLGVNVPNNFHYFYAKTLFSNKNYKKTMDELELFLEHGGDKSKHYMKALELYAKVERLNETVCDEERMCNAEYTTCIIDNSKVLEKRLDRTYQSFLEKQDDKVYKKKIEKSQLIWKKYREAQLEMAFPHADNPKYFWTGFNACYYRYQNDLTLKRIEEIEGWEKWLDESDCKSYDTTK